MGVSAKRFMAALAAAAIAPQAGLASYSAGLALVAAEQSGPFLVAYAPGEGGALDEMWRWDPKEDPSIGAREAGTFKFIDECKPVFDGGRTILVTASLGGVAAIDVATRRAKWCAFVKPNGDGPHSAALLPDGCVAVANSVSANEVVLVDPHEHPFDPDRQRKIRAAALSGAHGVCWHEKRDSLFVLGYTNIVEYGYDSAKFALSERNRWDFSKDCGDPWGHDFVPDGKGAFDFTNHSGVWNFDPATGKFKPVLAKAHVKSWSRDEKSGDLMATPREGWWTDRLTLRKDAEETELGPVPKAMFYKARWLK